MDQSWGMTTVDPWASWGESRPCFLIRHIGYYVVVSPISNLPLLGIRAGGERGGGLVQIRLLAELEQERI